MLSKACENLSLYQHERMIQTPEIGMKVNWSCRKLTASDTVVS